MSKRFDAEKIREYCDLMYDAYTKYAQAADRAQGACAFFAESDSFTGQQADATKKLVGTAEIGLIDDILDIAQGIKTAQEEVMDLFHTDVDAAPNALIDEEILEQINQEFKTYYSEFDSIGNQVESIYSKLQRFREYGTFTKPDFDSGRHAMRDLCGGDGKGGYIEECIEKLNCFDQEAAARLDSYCLQDRMEAISVRLGAAAQSMMAHDSCSPGGCKQALSRLGTMSIQGGAASVTAALMMDTRLAYDCRLRELIEFSEDGTIKSIHYDSVAEYTKKLFMGELTVAQIEALKTFALVFQGHIVKMTGNEERVNTALRKLAEIQDTIGNGWSFLGFAYNSQAQHFYTKQDSAQSWFGFMDMYDDFGAGFGMDLDTEKIQFCYEGKEYRFQVWKGTYGYGTLAGAEQGWYVYDPNNKAHVVADRIAEWLGQEDFVPVAGTEDRIRMANTVYNETTGRRVTQRNDSIKTTLEGAYWNLTTSAKHPGYVKSNLYTKGELYIDDAALRNEVYLQLCNNKAFSDVEKIGEDRIVYTWKD